MTLVSFSGVLFGCVRFGGEKEACQIMKKEKNQMKEKGKKKKITESFLQPDFFVKNITTKKLSNKSESQRRGTRGRKKKEKN